MCKDLKVFGKKYPEHTKEQVKTSINIFLKVAIFMW